MSNITFKYVNISQDWKKTQEILDNAIEQKYNYYVNLCRPTDSYKFMLVYDKEANRLQPHIGFKVIHASQDMKITENLINEAANKLTADGDKTFVNLFYPNEYMFIMMYEYRSGLFPFFKVLPIIHDAKMASRKTTDTIFDLYDKHPDFNLEPYDVIPVNQQNMIMLFQ